jgi:hypothetical protein
VWLRGNNTFVPALGTPHLDLRLLICGFSSLNRGWVGFHNQSIFEPGLPQVHNLAAVQLGTSAMEIVYLILSSALFAAGVSCGYYVRDRISRKRRERYLRSKRYIKIPLSTNEHSGRATN